MLYCKRFRKSCLLSILGFLPLTSILYSTAISAQENAVPTENIVVLTPTDEVYNFHTHQKINDYTEKLAHDLIGNMRDKALKQPMMVTSFVKLDDTLKKTTKLGNLISENLIGNMQAYDIPIVDIHLTGSVDITPTGDYVLSRDDSDILYGSKVGYVLSGVFFKNERGYIINARIMELTTKKIISTASTFIPLFVVESI